MRLVGVFIVSVTLLLCLATPEAEARRRGVPRVEPPPVLSIRLESGLGLNICVDHDDFNCARQGEDVGAFGRAEVTFRALHLADWLGLGLRMDLGGYVPDAPRGVDNASITFHMAAMVRGFIPLPNERIDLTAGIGIGLAHWTRTSSGGGVDTTTRWTGMTIPIAAGLGYEILPGLVVGGDLTFQPRIAGDICTAIDSGGLTISACGGGDLPFNLQLGAYIAYTFPVTLDVD